MYYFFLRRLEVVPGSISSHAARSYVIRKLLSLANCLNISVCSASKGLGICMQQGVPLRSTYFFYLTDSDVSKSVKEISLKKSDVVAELSLNFTIRFGQNRSG